MPNERVTRGYVVGPGEGVPGREPDVKASGQSTGGSLTVIEAMIDGGPARHTHSREDESFYVLTGDPGRRVRRGPVPGWAGVVCVPAAQPAARLPVRGWSGDSAADRDAGRLDEYFAELSAGLAANADSAQPRTIQQAYGITRS